MVNISSDQITWCCQVCWNLGVIHARAEDFKSAHFGFKWCWDFAQRCAEFKFKSGFYYLTAKLCESEVMITEEDFQVMKDCESDGSVTEFEDQMICLKIEMMLRCRKWKDLEQVLKMNSTRIGFEGIAEIVLRSSEEVPLEIYQLILKRLTENEFERQDFDIQRFSGLFRGLTTCALLQFPGDLSHFQSALKMIKSSFGRYPSEEVTWLCGTALEMGRRAYEDLGEFEKAGEWTEMSMNLVYLINSETEDNLLIKSSLQESVLKLKGYFMYTFNVFVDTKII